MQPEERARVESTAAACAEPRRRAGFKGSGGRRAQPLEGGRRADLPRAADAQQPRVPTPTARPGRRSPPLAGERAQARVRAAEPTAVAVG